MKAARWKIPRMRRRTKSGCSRASPQDAPDKPEDVTIGFEAGRPVSVNGKKMSAVALLEELNRIGGKHGVGPRRSGGESLRRHEVARLL